MRRGGFTIIELLVVIAVIALLIAILLPMLGESKRAARNAACMAGLRDAAIASGLVFWRTDKMPKTWAEAGIPTVFCPESGAEHMHVSGLMSDRLFRIAADHFPTNRIPVVTDAVACHKHAGKGVHSYAGFLDGSAAPYEHGDWPI